jgi:adenylate cyclase
MKFWERLTPLRIALVLGLILAGLRFSGCRYLELVDVRAVDYRLLQRGVQSASDAVVVVGVDDESLDELGRWPWSRTVVARLVDRLVAADVAVIGFDIVQSERTADIDMTRLPEQLEGVDEEAWATVKSALGRGSLDEARLAEAIRRSGRTVAGFFFDFSRGEGAEPDQQLSSYNIVQHSAGGNGERRVRHASFATVNLPEINAAARETGYFNFFPDDLDGYYRRVPLIIRYGEQMALPLSLAMLRVYRPEQPLAIRFADFGVEFVRVGAVSVPVAEDGQMLINYRGPGKTFRHVSAADVLAGRVAPESLRGKLALVGVTATAVADVRATPFDGVLPGVEIHANVLDNILREDFVHQPKWIVLVEIGVILASVVILGIILQYARGVLGAVVAVTLLGGYLGASQWLFVAQGMPLSLVYPILAVSLTYTAIGVQHYVTVERERRKTRKTLELYLSPSLARMVSEHPDRLKLGGEKSERTVLFSDIRGFTTISERLDAEALVELLNAFLGEMTEVIFTHDGMLDKYIGDAIMAVWGAPLPQGDHAARAVRAALGMVERLRSLEPTWRERGWPSIHIGIGLNSGPMVFGNMGSAQHMSLTVIGDEVNLGSRLEGLCKYYGSGIILSEATVREAGDAAVARELDLVRVKGKLQPVRIFDLLGPGDERERWTLLLERFNAGINFYRQRQWEDALQTFQSILEIQPKDGPAALYVERCRSMLETPPDPDWDGVTVMEAK